MVKKYPVHQKLQICKILIGLYKYGHGMLCLQLKKYLKSLLGNYIWNFHVLIKKNLGVKSAKIKIAKIAKSAKTAKIKLRENISMYSS